MLTVERVGSQEWQFQVPARGRQATDQFYRGCELLEEGRVPEALTIFHGLLQRHPEHLDVRNTLAQYYVERGETDRAMALLEEAVALGRQAFPPAFRAGHLLEWGWLENRPFLRCLCSLGMLYERAGRLESALEIYRQLLSLNPNDNQGVRALAVTVLLALKRPEEVIKVCAAYPEDMMPEIAYGQVLALFQLGKDTDAAQTLQSAVRWLPLVAKELLKPRHRRPKSAIPGFLTMGGADEAYDYWQHHGKFWQETPGVLSWLAEIVHAPRRRQRRTKG